jgi:uncharacterized protein YjdB
MAVYPDVCAPSLAIGDRQLHQGATEVIDLIHAVNDPDNMSALAVSTAVSDNDQVARVRVEGTDLHVEAVAPGGAVITVTTDSNGKLVTESFTVTVTAGSIPGDVNMDGKVTIADVTDLIDILLGSVLNIYDLGAADVDKDGRITIADVTELIDRLLSEN